MLRSIKPEVLLALEVNQVFLPCATHHKLAKRIDFAQLGSLFCDVSNNLIRSRRYGLSFIHPNRSQILLRNTNTILPSRTTALHMFISFPPGSHEEVGCPPRQCPHGRLTNVCRPAPTLGWAHKQSITYASFPLCLSPTHKEKREREIDTGGENLRLSCSLTPSAPITHSS